MKRGGKPVDRGEDGELGGRELLRRRKVAEMKKRQESQRVGQAQGGRGGTNWLSLALTLFFVYQHLFGGS